MTETEQQTPEAPDDLDAQIAELRAKKREAKLIEHQRTVLLPQLNARRDRLGREIGVLEAERNLVLSAIAEVREGHLTDYRMRAAPKRKKKAQEAAP